MNFLETFAPHLPYLRRYARALSGSQAAGDELIGATLKVMAGDPKLVDDALEPRISLFRLFHDAVVEAHFSSAIAVADRRLARLAPAQRQAFLLTSMENFTREEAALVLDVDAAEIDRLNDQAQRDIESDLKTSVLIIEDEPIIAADIEALVEELGHTVVAIASTLSQAVDMARRTQPGLVLCDIQLADNSSGIDASREILGFLVVPVIFVTAFPERLLTGERPEPTYLVPKPFQENTIKAVIGQALFFHPAKAEKEGAQD